MGLNPIQRVQRQIEAALPSSSSRIDPADADHEWWLDVHLGQEAVAIQWSKRRGFGISSSAFGAGLGEGPEEVLNEPDVAARVIQLLRSGEATKPPLEVALRELRILSGLTQEQVATRMGVQQAAVSRFERRSDLTLRALRRFVSALGGELEVRVRTSTGEHVQLENVAEPDAWR